MVGEVYVGECERLSNTIVKNKLKERYGDHIPVNEKVISPAAIFDAEKLLTILEEQ